MRIETFAAENRISVRTLRYYIDLKLLCPGKKEGRLYFDDGCAKDLAMILRLKQSGLTMGEIQEWFFLDRSQGMEPDKRERHLAVLRAKLAKLTEDMSGLQKMLRNVATRIKSYPKTIEHSANGSSLKMMEYVCCPYCDKPLEYHAVHIVDNNILEGRAECSCGYEILIKDGIFIVQQADPQLPTIIPLDFHRETYNRMPPDEVSKLQINYNWVLKQLKMADLAGKVVFENSVDVISFLSTGIAYLNPDAKYIIADSDFHVLKDAKDRIDALGVAPTVLYIVSPNLLFPIKKQCIDLLIDYYTTEVLQRLNIPTLVQGMRPYLKPSSHLIGVFIYIKKGNGTIKNNAKRYPNSYKGRYQLKALQENLSQNGVHIITEMTSNFNSGSAALETYQKGDILGVNCFWGVLSKE